MNPLLALQTDVAAIANSINTVWVLVATFLIFFMQPGFALLEAGQVRAKNAGNVVMKNMWDWSAGVLTFFLVGAAVSTMVAALTAPGTALDVAGAFAYISDPGGWVSWLFGAVFAMTAATIVSGAVAERMKFSAYVVYAVAMVAVIYPVVLGFTWDGGLLSADGYVGQALGVGYLDFAGATVVHALGGIAGLTAAYMVGPRKGRFDSNGNSRPIPGHSLLFAVIGTLILAFGWYGFNVGTQATVLTSEGEFMGAALGRVALNTTLAMGMGMVASTAVTTVWEGKPDPLFGANGLLAGLVAITGACAHVTWWGALVIGLIGGAQTPLVYRWTVDSLNIDDVCGVFAVHGSAGFIGTILIPVFAVDGFVLNQLIMQVVGALVIGTWTVLATMLVLGVLDGAIGLRVSEEDEEVGLDRGEHGLAAYPEFTGDEPAVADGGPPHTDGGRDVRTDGGSEDDDDPEIVTDGGIDKGIRTDGGGVDRDHDGTTREADERGLERAEPGADGRLRTDGGEEVDVDADDHENDPEEIELVMAFIRPDKLPNVKRGLAEVGAPSLSVTNVSGRGSQPATTGQWRGEEYTVDLHQKVKVECVVADIAGSAVAEAISEAAHTGEPGDGKVFVIPVSDAYQIRTGEQGPDAV